MNEKKRWLLRPESIKTLWVILYTSLAFTIILELFTPHKGHFGIDGYFGFYAWFGFLSCVLMVLFAKLLGLLIKRKDTYYDE